MMDPVSYRPCKLLHLAYSEDPDKQLEVRENPKLNEETFQFYPRSRKLTFYTHVVYDSGTGRVILKGQHSLE